MSKQHKKGIRPSPKYLLDDLLSQQSWIQKVHFFYHGDVSNHIKFCVQTPTEEFNWIIRNDCPFSVANFNDELKARLVECEMSESNVNSFEKQITAFSKKFPKFCGAYIFCYERSEGLKLLPEPLPGQEINE